MSASLDGLYQQVILDHAKARHGDVSSAEGLAAPGSAADGPHAQHYERNPTCGDELTLRLVLEPDSDRIADLRWHGAGCSISMASASVLAQLAPGLTLDELTARVGEFRRMMRSRGAGEPDDEVLGDAVVFHGVSKFVMRVKCGMLAWVAAEACAHELAAV